MRLYYEHQDIRIYQGDCRDLSLPAGSVESIVTDPPYGIGMMGLDWDGGVAFDSDLWMALMGCVRPDGWVAAFGACRTYHRLASAIEAAGGTIHDTLAWIFGQGRPASKTRLKPAWEPIVLASRSPRPPVMAVESSRVAHDGVRPIHVTQRHKPYQAVNCYKSQKRRVRSGVEANLGRWPANVCLDGSAAVCEAIGPGHRFFYSGKAKSEAQRGRGNHHPTVKPIPLMEWIVKLLATGGGSVLDPFAGSGTTLVAAANLGIPAVGVEINERYCEVAARRLDDLFDSGPVLFGGSGAV